MVGILEAQVEKQKPERKKKTLRKNRCLFFKSMLKKSRCEYQRFTSIFTGVLNNFIRFFKKLVWSEARIAGKDKANIALQNSRTR